MIDRRTFVGAVASVLMDVPFDANGQPERRVPRIGVLTMSVSSSMSAFEGFRQGLLDHGYVDGVSVFLVFRFAQGRPERLATMAAELVQIKVEIMVTESNLATQAAIDASKTIPIVMAVV